MTPVAAGVLLVVVPEHPRSKIRVNITVDPADHARLKLASEADRGASLSHWLVSLGLKRADRLRVPRTVEPATPRGRGLGRVRK